MPTNKKAIPSISLVVPFYNEQDGIALFFEKITQILKAITRDYEIICINDGSTDQTLAILKKQHKKDKRIKILNFSRNFGKEAALTAGITFATLDVVIPIDADLQDPPELIASMVDKWREGYDVVVAQRRHRHDRFFKRITAQLFHKFFAYLTNNNLNPNAGDYRLMDRKVIEVIKLFPEKTRYMKGLFSWVGFKTVAVQYDRPLRTFGNSKIPVYKLFKLAFDGIFSFSTKPLKIWFYIGLFISMISFTYASFLLLRKIIIGADLPGYTSIMVGVLFMGGIQLISLGVIGEYIARIYKEVKNRPVYIVDEKHGIDDKKGK